MNIPLKAGYNMVAVGYGLEIATAEDLVLAIPNCTGVWKMVGTEWSGHRAGGLNNFDIIEGQSYMVYVTTDGVWIVPDQDGTLGQSALPNWSDVFDPYLGSMGSALDELKKNIVAPSAIRPFESGYAAQAETPAEEPKDPWMRWLAYAGIGFLAWLILKR